MVGELDEPLPNVITLFNFLRRLQHFQLSCRLELPLAFEGERGPGVRGGFGPLSLRQPRVVRHYGGGSLFVLNVPVN